MVLRRQRGATSALRGVPGRVLQPYNLEIGYSHSDAEENGHHIF